MFDLLAGKPEGEGRLLSALVNKLGDPDRKLASKVGVCCVVFVFVQPLAGWLC